MGYDFQANPSIEDFSSSLRGTQAHGLLEPLENIMSQRPLNFRLIFEVSFFLFPFQFLLFRFVSFRFVSFFFLLYFCGSFKLEFLKQKDILIHNQELKSTEQEQAKLEEERRKKAEQKFLDLLHVIILFFDFLVAFTLFFDY